MPKLSKVLKRLRADIDAVEKATLTSEGAKPGSITNPVAVVVKAAEPQSGEFAAVVALHKDEARQLVYGVVLTPGVRDSQDDVIEPADVEAAAHRFLTAYRKHDVQHDEQPAAIDTVESFIAPADCEIAGQPVLKGSWVLVSHVRDADTWQRVQKGEITGYSIGGTGERLPDAV